MISDELVRAVAQAITDEIIRQEGSTDGQIKLPDDMVLQFIDQNNIDMSAVARNAIKATAAAIRAQVLEDAAMVADDMGRKEQTNTRDVDALMQACAREEMGYEIAAAIRAMKEPT